MEKYGLEYGNINSLNDPIIQSLPGLYTGEVYTTSQYFNTVPWCECSRVQQHSHHHKSVNSFSQMIIYFFLSMYRTLININMITRP